MGCCGSSEEEAKETALPPPIVGKGYHVRFLRQSGWGEKDFDVHRLDMPPDEDGKPPVWLLVDKVDGSDGDYEYKMKYRREGDDESVILATCSLKGISTFDHMIIDGARQQFMDLNWSELSMSDGGFDDFRDALENVEFKSVKAQWVLARRCKIFQDADMEEQIGYVDATAYGMCWKTWKRVTSYVERTREDGSTYMDRQVREYRTCNVRAKGLQYKLDLHNSPMVVSVQQTSGGSFSKSESYAWTGTASNGATIFTASGTGSKSSDVSTGDGTEPKSTLLAAFVVSVCLDPKEMESRAKKACERHVSVWSHPGETGHLGIDSAGTREQQYFAKYVQSAHAAGLFDAVAVEPFRKEHDAQLTFVAGEELTILATDVVVFELPADDDPPDLGVKLEVKPRGVVITDAHPDGLAWSRDMRKGDVIKRINDVAVEDDADVVEEALKGDPIKMTVDGKKKKVMIVAVERGLDENGEEAIGNAYAESHGDFGWWIARRKADAVVGLVPDTGYLRVLPKMAQGQVPLAVAEGAQQPVATPVAVATAEPVAPIAVPIAEPAEEPEAEPGNASTDDGEDVVQKLRSLKQLKDEGVIDDDEFEAKKEELLKRI